MMKRSSPLPKRSPKRLQADGGQVRYSTITSKPKPIRKRNPERQAKRTASYRKGLALYKKSETAKLVKARAEGRCEAVVVRPNPSGWSATLPEYANTSERCPATEGLQAHHLCYSLRFGGNEVPEDMVMLCKDCHARAEAMKPAKNRFARNH